MYPLGTQLYADGKEWEVNFIDMQYSTVIGYQLYEMNAGINGEWRSVSAEEIQRYTLTPPRPSQRHSQPSN